jgi:hypothetical protein
MKIKIKLKRNKQIKKERKKERKKFKALKIANEVHASINTSWC